MAAHDTDAPRNRSEHAQSLGWIVWPLIGIASALGALMVGAGSWKSPWIVGALATGLSIGLALIVGVIDESTPASKVKGVVVSVLVGLSSLAWGVDTVRHHALENLHPVMPESALQTAFVVEDRALAVRACEGLLERDMGTYGMLSLLEQRPTAGALCLSSNAIENPDRIDNLSRRLAQTWSAQLMDGNGANMCALAAPLHRVLKRNRAGTQRLLRIAVGASSSDVRSCTIRLVQDEFKGDSKLKFLEGLGSVDLLPEKEALQLHRGLSREFASKNSPIQKLDHASLLSGWTLALGCRSDLIAGDSARASVSSRAPSTQCGQENYTVSMGTWTSVCKDLSEISVTELPEKSCSIIARWAREEAVAHTSQLIGAAAEAYRQSDTYAAVRGAHSVRVADQPYEERFGSREILQNLESSGAPPLIRNQLIQQMQGIHRGSRQLTREDLENMEAAEKRENPEEQLDGVRDKLNEVLGSDDEALKGVLDSMDSEEREALETFLK